MKDLVKDHQAPDVVYYGGKVATMDDQGTVAEAVAVKDGVFQAVGTSEEIKALAGKQTQHVDLRGGLTLPGFIDSHEHVIRRGLQMDYVYCATPPMGSIEDVVEALRSKAETKQPGDWVLGTWFDETKLKEHRFPTRRDLDRASTLNPIYLGRAGGHNAVANSLALTLAGITRETPQPPGGHIEKDETGEPTGRLDEVAAMNMVRRIIPEPSPEEAVALMARNWPQLEEKLLSWGITTVHEAHIKASEAQAYQRLLSSGGLHMRVGLMLDGMNPYDGYATHDLKRQGLQTGFGWGDRLYVVGVKVGIDGAMGSLTAALTEPYSNDPGNTGIIRVDHDAFKAEVAECHAAGLRTCIHAIGDRAIDLALDAVEEAQQTREWADHRHRIEHAGYVRPDQLERMSRLGVAVSASIGFCYPIGDSHIDALGEERLDGYYPMRSFKTHGIVAGGNSDGFGENWALTGIYGCVSRLSSSGRPLAAEQGIPVVDAIRAYGVNGAYLEGTEESKGTIEPGNLADMVVLDTDILSSGHSGILHAKVMVTIVGGEVVYTR